MAFGRRGDPGAGLAAAGLLRGVAPRNAPERSKLMSARITYPKRPSLHEPGAHMAPSTAGLRVRPEKCEAVFR